MTKLCDVVLRTMVNIPLYCPLSNVFVILGTCHRRRMINIRNIQHNTRQVKIGLYPIPRTNLQPHRLLLKRDTMSL